MLNPVKGKGRVLEEKLMGCCVGRRRYGGGRGIFIRLGKASKRTGHFKQSLRNEQEFR